MPRLLSLVGLFAIFSVVASQSCSKLDLPRGCLCQPLGSDGVSLTCSRMTSSSQVLDVLKNTKNCLEFILTDSDLPSLPLGIGPHRLEKLSIENSRIPYLSPPNSKESAFQGLNNLNRIKLENLKDISEWDWTKLQNLSNLKTIFIDGGRFANIPASFSTAGNENVEEVVLSHCEIHRVEDGGLAFPQLKFLQLSDNQLRELRAEMFHPQSNIENLIAYDMPLTTLPEDVFKGMKKLKSFLTDKSILALMTEKHVEHLQLQQIGLFTGKAGKKARCDCKYIWMLKPKTKFLYECYDDQDREHDFQQFLDSCEPY